jgi:hypothetical protein
MACEAAVIMRRRSAYFIRARRPLEAFNQRPNICQHLSSFVCQFNRPLASAAGPYILPIESLDAAREFLGYADLTQYSIYPDIVGMARDITRKAFGEAFGC